MTLPNPLSRIALLALAALASQANAGEAPCDNRMKYQLSSLAEGYERCAVVQRAGECHARFESDEKYLASAGKYCEGEPLHGRALEALNAAKLHLAALQRAATESQATQKADREALSRRFADLKARLTEPAGRYTLNQPPRPTRLIASDDEAYDRLRSELGALHQQLEGFAARYPADQLIQLVRPALSGWDAALDEDRQRFVAIRPVAEHLVVKHGPFTAEDARSPSKIAEAFAALGKEHLLAVAINAKPELPWPWFRFTPNTARADARRVEKMPAASYHWRFERGESWPVRVDLEPLAQTELPMGTPLLAWAMTEDGESFIAVTPDGARYAAKTYTREGKAFVGATRVAAGERLRFKPLQHLFPVYEDFAQGFGDISERTLGEIPRRAEAVRRCHQQLTERFDKEAAPLETLHEDLIARGLVAESVWRKLEKVRERSQAAHEKGCTPHSKGLEQAVTAAQREYAQARKKAWAKASTALALEVSSGSPAPGD